MKKISLYSETFGKRVTRWYNVSVLDNVLDVSNDSNLFDNIVDYLLRVSGYDKLKNEYVTYIFK